MAKLSINDFFEYYDLGGRLAPDGGGEDRVLPPLGSLLVFFFCDGK